MTRQQKSYRIAVILNGNLKPDQDHISGILRFAATHPEWDVFLFSDHPSNRRFVEANDWHPDGIIISDFAVERGMHDDLCRKARAIVMVMSSRNVSPFAGARFATINVNNRDIGQTAAAFFVKKGFRHFGFIGTPHERKWSNDRGRAFVGALAAQGFVCDCYEADKDETDTVGWELERRRLKEWLLSLPKPCGILAAYDQRAKHVLDVCRQAQIAVPEQVGVLSVDNEEFLCEHTVPTLSSIVPDFESCGHRAAQVLNRLLRGGKAPSRSVKFGVRGIVERFSTSDFSGSARIVELAREFIRKNFSANLSTDDIARAAGVSKRVLEMRFRTSVGTTPSGELRKYRLEHVKKLLLKSETPIKSIGYLCGFQSEIHLKNLFKSHFGVSMQSFRKQHTT